MSEQGFDINIEYVGKHMTKGHWVAKVNGVSLTRKFGSWMYEDTEKGILLDVLPDVAAYLQEEVRRREKGEDKKFAKLAENSEPTVTMQDQPDDQPLAQPDAPIPADTAATAA